MDRTCRLITAGLLSVLLLGAAAGCGGGAANEPPVGIEWSLSPDPPRVGPSTLTVVLGDSLDRPVTGAAIEMEANMSHAGMQPVFAEATEQDSGRYTVPFEFSMAGDWFLLLDITLPGSETAERTLRVPGVQGK